jgi:lysophospholipase L1-like esterase
VVLLVLSATLTACSGAAGSTRWATGSTGTGELTAVAVGDSVTAADSPNFSAASFGPASWASTADGNGVKLTGGWAVSGATTMDMRNGVGRLEADAVVIMAGTNDVRQNVPWDQSAAALDGIVRVVGVRRVLICSIVPLAADPDAAQAFNARLQEMATQKGWEYADTAAVVRSADGQWLPGMSGDGIHPNPVGAAKIGTAVHAALVG